MTTTMQARTNEHPSVTCNSLSRDIILGMLGGIVIGTTLELLGSAVHGGSAYVPGVPSFLASFANEHTAVLVERIVYALLGLTMNLPRRLFDLDRLSLAAATALHFLIVIGSLLVAGIYLQWAQMGPQLISFIAIASAIYFVIWFIIWFSIRHKISQMNQRLGARTPRA
ncbi:DUF3021 domain-containing protein [Collinsella sp. AGMB00827]|uniref:DUF3021 domain-containing protein n=1 Tax=Collinsella ureilytica TaxID=2869515 RepID=A0ABS7MLH3_9ACTN|nr:DUF3021 domain-containing protein [Collinsella urealyticum]MBY4798219.1 DUF3021 domain-containing protein [Collinsella urealyticum]